MTQVLRATQQIRLVIDFDPVVDHRDFLPSDIQLQITALLKADPRVAEVWFSGMPETATAYRNLCRVGGEEFVANKPDTDVCRDHWYAESIRLTEEEHAPLFDPIKEGSDGKLVGVIHQSGGMTMTIVIPTENGAYLGLKEGEDEDGNWGGSLAFYLPDGDIDRTDSERFNCYAYKDEPDRELVTYDGVPPAEWARRVLDDWRTNPT